MKVPSFVLGSVCLFVLAACATRETSVRLPEHRFDAQPPSASPKALPVAGRLVDYPGIDVAYVAGADSETYLYKGVYYTYYQDNWFKADSIQGPWKFVEMKYVPGDVYRVKGHVPPSLDR